MKPDDVEAEAGKTVRHFLREFFVGNLACSDQIRSVETDGFFRTVAEDKVPVRVQNDRTVFSRGGVESCGEIERASGFDIVCVCERFPILVRFGFVDGFCDGTEVFSELSGLALTDAQADFRFLNAACVRGVSETDVECGAVPFAVVLNTQIVVALNQNFAVFDGDAEAFCASCIECFFCELFRELVNFPVDFKRSAAVAGDRKQRIETERFDKSSTFHFNGADNPFLSFESEREFSRGSVGEVHLEEHAVLRLDSFENLPVGGGLQTVPVFCIGGRGCAPAVEFNVAVLEQLQISCGEKSGNSGQQKKRCDFFHEETLVLSRVVKRAEFFSELSGIPLADAQADFRFLNAACVRGEAEPDIE